MRQALWLHLLFMVVVSAIGLLRVRYYRRQRRAFGIRFASRGKTLNEVRQVAAMLALLLMLLHTINPNILSWTEFPLPYVVRWIGGGAAVLSVVLLAWAADDAVHGVLADDPLPLHTTGPYAVVRHPLDAAIAFVAVALTVLSANWVIGLVSGVMAAHALFVRARRNAEQLRTTYGEAYQSYAAHTPRFVPRLRAKAPSVEAAARDR